MVSHHSACPGDEGTYNTSVHPRCRRHHGSSSSEDDEALDEVHVN